MGFANYLPDPVPLEPASVATQYQPLLRKAAEGAAFMSNIGIPAFHVANAITHAIESRYPADRYLVGLDAKMLSYVRPLVPEWMADVVGLGTW
jgi:hypothetical protein